MTLIHKKLRNNFALTLLLLVGCLPTSLVSACSCFQQNVSEALESATNVFSGNVTKIIPGVCLGDNTVTTFAIDMIWKRGNNTNITMLAKNDDNNDVLLYNVSSSATEGICGGLCGYDFQLNTKYIVFTWRDSVSLCTLTRVFSDSMALELDSLSPPEWTINPTNNNSTQELNNSTITTTMPTNNSTTFSLQSSSPEPEELACPTPSGYGICIHACNDDTSCPNSQMCCSNGCGMVCMDPVVETETERSAPENNSDDSTPLPTTTTESTTAEPTNPEASPETTTTTTAALQTNDDDDDDDDRRIKIWVTVVISCLVFFILVGFVLAVVVMCSRRRRNRTKISTINTTGTTETANTDDGLDISNIKPDDSNDDDDPENPSITNDSSTTNNKTTNEKSSSISSSSIDNNQQLGAVIQQSQYNTTTARSA